MEFYSISMILLVVASKLLHSKAGKALKSEPFPTCNTWIIGSTTFPCPEWYRKNCPELPRDEPNPGVWIKKNCLNPTQPTVVTPDFFNRSNTVFNHTRRQEENVLLRCHVHRFNENFILKWTKRDKRYEMSEPIFSSNMKTQLNSHISASLVYHGSNNDSLTAELRIFKLGPNDAGLYKCELQQISGGGTLSRSQIYMVTVRYPAQVRSIGPRAAPYWSADQPGRIYVNETDNVTLTCTADGFPKPKISWRLVRDSEVMREINDLARPDGSLPLSQITKNYSGTYVCSARNALNRNRNRPSSKSVKLIVQYAPRTNRTYVDNKVAASRYVLLQGSFTSQPGPTYQWLKNGKPLSNQNNSSEAFTGESLVIIMLDPEKHYANYTCIGKNLLGSASTTFDVNGRPYPPRIVNPNKLGSRRRSFELIWSPGLNDERGIPVTHYNVLYRRVETKAIGNVVKVNYYPNDAPNSVTIPGDVTKYYLTELKENSTYETAVCPSNAYGDGKCANFRFDTPNEDITIAPTVIERTENKAEKSPAPKPLFSGSGSCRVVPSLRCLLTVVSLALICASSMGTLQRDEKT